MVTVQLGNREAGLLCAAIGLLLYLNTLDCSLVYDDEEAISWNRDLRPSSPWSTLLIHDFWGMKLSSPLSHKSYRPLCVATFRLNYMWHGLSPMGYHMVNVLLHALVCYLYVQMCALVFNSVWPALLAGLLFAVHPIHTEAVAGVVGRAELLSAFFFLSSFLLYHRSINFKSQGSTSWYLLMLSLMAGVCAMLSKEQGITVFGVGLAYDVFILHQQNLGFLSKNSKHLLPAAQRTKNFFVRGVVMSATALIALTIRLQLSNGAPTNKAFATSSNPPLTQDSPLRQLSWLHLIFVNLKLLLFPSGLTADWRYGAAPLIKSVQDWNNALTILTFVSLFGFVACSSSRQQRVYQRIVFMGICLLSIPFLPASNLFFPVGFVVAERVLYLPSMGFCLLVGYGFWILLRKYSRSSVNWLVKLAFGYLLICQGVKTLSRNRDWLSGMSINKAGVRFNVRHAIMLSNLGIEHALKKDYERAEILYWTGMQSYPYYSGAFHNYGLLMNLLQRYDEAEEPLWKAIEYGATDTTSSKMAETYSLLSNVISMNSSRLMEALNLTEHVLSQYPEHTKSLTTKCSILLQLNKTGEFIHACEKALWYNQGDPSAYYDLSVAYSRLGYLSDAENVLRHMLERDSSSVRGKSHLANILQGTGKTKDLLEAKQLWTEVVAQEPHNLAALMKLSNVDSELQHYRQALKSLHSILQVNPHHKDALYKAGHLYIQTKNYHHAYEVLSRLLYIEPNHLHALTLMEKAQKLKNTTSIS